jgi:predicted homoserine dehydrogenase-like protein
MVPLETALEKRAADGDPVRIGLVGAGYIARGIAAHARRIRGIELVAVCGRQAVRAMEVFGESDPAPRHVETPAEIADALAARVPVVLEQPELLCRAEGIDAVIEATGSVEFGARTVLDAIGHHKPVVVANSDLDSTLGPILSARASEAGVVYSYTGGDEPGVAMDLLRYVRTIGLDPVIVGNIKGFLDHYRNPETQRAFADSVGQKANRITSYADGTKLAQESVIVANAAGFSIARRGMIGYRCSHVNDLLGLIDPKAQSGTGLVDYVLGAAPGSGVFVVAHIDDPVVRTYLEHFKMGAGPHYLFYIPWHLPQAEAPLTAARAVLSGYATVAPLGGPQCEVVSIAKRDLKAGDVLDGIGGFSTYGLIENIDVSRHEGLLPIGLSDSCTLVAEVARDSAVRYEDVAVPGGRLGDMLFAEQERLFAGSTAAVRGV